MNIYACKCTWWRLRSTALRLLGFARGIHRSPVNSPHKRPVTWKIFPFNDVIMYNVVHRVPSPVKKSKQNERYIHGCIVATIYPMIYNCLGKWRGPLVSNVACKNCLPWMIHNNWHAQCVIPLHSACVTIAQHAIFIFDSPNNNTSNAFGLGSSQRENIILRIVLWWGFRIITGIKRNIKLTVLC